MTDEHHPQTTCQPDRAPSSCGERGRRPPACADPQHEHDACGVGFVVDIKGRKSHAIVRQALQVLMNLAAPRRLRLRGRTRATAPASSSRCRTASCARSRRRRCRRPASTASAWSSCRARPATARRSSGSFAQIIAEEGQRLIGWRDVPTDDSPIGPSAVAVEPVFKQIFIGAGRQDSTGSGDERARVRAEAVRHPQADRARGRRAAACRSRRRSSSTSSACRATR